MGMLQLEENHFDPQHPHYTTLGADRIYAKNPRNETSDQPFLDSWVLKLL